MRFKSWMTVALLTVLVSGCGIRMGSDSYCDITKPLMFDGQKTVDWLLNNDKKLLVDVIVHNETNERICGG